MEDEMDRYHAEMDRQDEERLFAEEGEQVVEDEALDERVELWQVDGEVTAIDSGDKEQAVAYARAYRYRKEQRAGIEASFKSEIARLTRRMNEELMRADDRIEFLYLSLKKHFVAGGAADQVYANLGMHKQRQKVRFVDPATGEITDDPADFLKVYPNTSEYVRVTREVDKDAVKKGLLMHGNDVRRYATMDRPPAKFSVTVKK